MLRLESARTRRSMSELVEQALRARKGSEGKKRPLPGGPEAAANEVSEALAKYGAPLWSNGRPTDLTLEQAVAAGLAQARRHPSLLRVLPTVLWRNRRRLSLNRLRCEVGKPGLPALGMVLDLTAEVTGSDKFRRWADGLFGAGAKQDPPVPFFESGATGRRYLELARLRTPEVVRRWGFYMATPLDDFQDAVRRFCRDLRSSTGRT